MSARIGRGLRIGPRGGVSLGRLILTASGGVAVPSGWILATGTWNDSGVWDDTATWKDA